MRNLPYVLVTMFLMLAIAGCGSDSTSAPTLSPTSAAAATATPTLSPNATPTSTALSGPTDTPSPVPGATAVSITPSSDATLYDRGALAAANGVGQALFFGSTNGNEARRALIRFDVAAELPAGAQIVSVRLVLVVTRSRAEPDEATLHRVTASWGEGTADSQTAGEGSGTEPDAGSATWAHREFPDVMWTTPGGDFEAEPIATALVLPPPPAQPTEVTWGSTDGMVSDVQRWLDDSQSNFGWLVMGNEGTRQTAKRVASREHNNEELRPRLLIEYLPPGA